ncbi:MAG: folate-binding protein [Pseudomonadota bacterium]
MTEFSLLSDRAVLAVEGEDVSDFLQGLLTQDVTSASHDGAAFAALLTPQGKILFDFFLVPSEAGFLIDVAKDAVDAFAKRLKLYKLRAKITIDKRDDLAVGWSPSDSAADGGFVDPRGAGFGARCIAAPRTFSGGAADAAYDAHRLAAGAPEFGKDFESDSVFLLDVNYDALSGVDYKKGCFVGQEVTSRMKRKGEVRKRTYCVSGAGAPPENGAALKAGAATLGEITSVGADPADGDQWRALARVRVDRVAAAEAAPKIDGRAIDLAAPSYL